MFSKRRVRISYRLTRSEYLGNCISSYGTLQNKMLSVFIFCQKGFTFCEFVLLTALKRCIEIHMYTDKRKRTTPLQIPSHLNLL